MTREAKLSAGDPDEDLQQTLVRAVRDAIRKVGVDMFRKTSMFGSNQRPHPEPSS